jgi:DNA-binding LytR/AlgR family response regulator
MNALGNKHKTRFVVKVGEHIRFVNTEDIFYFYSYDKSTFLLTNNGKSYDLDYSLDVIEDIVNPVVFFRINRKYIINLNSIIDIVSFTNSRLKLRVKHSNEDDFIVSREKVQDFKSWLEG